MTSSKPYLLRAMYEWLADNNLTPYVMVEATLSNVTVPQRFVEDGKIILNIAMRAVRHLHLGNEAVSFEARFSGVVEQIYIPIEAIAAIYAYENGRGMVFGEEDNGGVEGEEGSSGDDTPPPSSPKPPKGKGPSLKVVK